MCLRSSVTAALRPGGSSAATAQERASHAGGTYRVAYESSFGFTRRLRPDRASTSTWSLAIYSNLLVRTLVGYNHVAGPAGNKLVPDIATSVPTPTDGGKTYTFHLKRGVRFGPPVDREVTSKDVLYAFERIANPKNGAQYGFYYSVIAGFDAYGAGKAKTISGIETPDAQHDRLPPDAARRGDFLYRARDAGDRADPGRGREVLRGQGRRATAATVVSTGPYMIEGADKIDASSCTTLKPMTRLRRPDAADARPQPELRPEDRLEGRAREPSRPLRVHGRPERRATSSTRVAAGELEDENAASIPPQTLRRYSRVERAAQVPAPQLRATSPTT